MGGVIDRGHTAERADCTPQREMQSEHREHRLRSTAISPHIEVPQLIVARLMSLGIMLILLVLVKFEGDGSY